jgi:hypothetical protein
MKWHEMSDDQPKRGRGRPRVYGKRQNFNFRLTDEKRQLLIESSLKNGRSLSEEIEFRLGRDFGWEATQNDIEEIKRRAVAWEDASRVKAIRAAGLTILREIDGRPTRAVVDIETLLAEADGIAHGLRPGFVDAKAPPAVSVSRPMTAEEADRVLAQMDEIRRELDAARERMAAEDAAGMGKDD